MFFRRWAKRNGRHRIACRGQHRLREFNYGVRCVGVTRAKIAGAVEDERPGTLNRAVIDYAIVGQDHIRNETHGRGCSRRRQISGVEFVDGCRGVVGDRPQRTAVAVSMIATVG